ncbi:MAG: hypothetical protein CML17_07360 [Pusillimonas sp.]|nr:hypothetical protein [Pusillimonas sp.]
MRWLEGWESNRTLRSYALLFLVVATFTTLLPGVDFLSARTLSSVFQYFATIGLVALALGLTMIVREFDISVAGMMSLGGCIAVLYGNEFAVLGLFLAVLVGLLGGLVQSYLMIRFNLSSVAVTLGGLLTWVGLAYVITGNQTIPFEKMDVAIAINTTWFWGLSPRSIVVIVLFLMASAFMAFTRVGRDMVAIGSHRHASIVAGLKPNKILMGVFSLSGMLAALAGAMLSFGLSSASPSGGVTDVLVPAVAAAILGGVSLSGGVGRPLGIAAGMLILCVTRTGLTSLGVDPYVHDVVTGCILMLVAVIDGPHLRMRLYQMTRVLR